MADTNHDIKIKTIEPYDSVPYIPLNNVELESRHGANFFSNVKQFAAGFGSKVFRVDRDGLWLGAETFSQAPFSVDMEGNVKLTSITTLTGFTDQDLTSIALPTNGIRVDSNGIYGRQSGTTTFSLDTSGNAYFSGDIEGSTVTGGTVRTSASGARVQMLEATNTLQILDSSGVVRAESYSNGWEFNNSVGSVRGRVFIENTFGNLQIQSTSADVFLAAASDIAFATGNGSITMYIDATSKDLVISSGDIVLGSTTISGGGSWTLTLPSTNGSSGQFLQTDGSGNTTWASVTGGADTDLNNLTTTSINVSLTPEGATQDLGTSSLPWDRLYVDDIYLTNNDGGIYYNSNLALDFYATRIELGSTYDEFSPSSSLQGNLGASSNRWNACFFDTIDMSGAIDMNNNRVNDIDEIRFRTGTANSAGAEGAIAFYDSGTIQYRGQIISTEYSFDLTTA